MSGDAGPGPVSPSTAGDRAADQTGGVLTRGTVVIDRERCKGCELCIPACRPGVLAMSTEVNAVGYRFPLLAPGCTGCRACHAVCPDFVFEVFKFDQPVVLPVADTDEGDAADRGTSHDHHDRSAEGAP